MTEAADMDAALPTSTAEARRSIAQFDLKTAPRSRSESAKRRMQRELVGAQTTPPAKATAAAGALPQDANMSTPVASTSSAREGEIAFATPEAMQVEPQASAQPTASHEAERRRTLSPSKALAFFSQNSTDVAATSSSSRRDTVSPDAMRSMLQSVQRDTLADRPNETRRTRARAIADGDGHDTHDGASKQQRAQLDQRQQRGGASKATANAADDQEDEAAFDQVSFTDGFFSSELLSQDEPAENGSLQARRSTLEPDEADAALAELRMDSLDPSSNQRRRSPRLHKDAAPSSPPSRGRKRPATTLGSADAASAHETPTGGGRRRDTLDQGGLEEMLGSAANLTTPSKQSTQGKRARFDKPNESDQSEAPNDIDEAMLSPPPNSSRVKTPLKSCLSAKKQKQKQMASPNKTVIFGLAQGAEFNTGSPSTSMTPIAARKAHAMFPMEEQRIEEDDDAETSLNSSILDEADARESDELLAEDAAAEMSSPSVTTRSRRRSTYALRGVSPLDARVNARLQRRLSVMSNPRSPARSTRLTVANDAISSTRQSSFLNTSQSFSKSRLAYADSSASSDEGEDMEITGDYSRQAITATALRDASKRSPGAKASSRASLERDSRVADSSLSERMVELGSLRDLVDESVAGDAEMSPKEDEDVPPLGSLSDLVDDESVVAAVQGQSLPDDNARGDHSTLGPIPEGDDEDRRSSSAPSVMSVDSGDESDGEYDQQRKSLVVNLSSKFERVGSGPTKGSVQRLTEDTAVNNDTAQPSVSKPVCLPVQEVLARANVCQEELTFSGADIAIPEIPSEHAAVVQSCCIEAFTDVIQHSHAEMATWASGLDQSLDVLAKENASEVFSEAKLTEDVMGSIQSLFTVEATSIQGDWCQLRTRMENAISERLVACENELRGDVNAIRSAIAEEDARRENELKTLKALLDRERQISELLDATEEQQEVQREYVGTVESLESQCAALSLEESVLQKQLASLDSNSAHEPATASAVTALRNEVLELEEMLAVREMIGLWRVLSVTASTMELGADLDDLFFSIQVRISVEVSGEGADRTVSLEAQPVVLPKRLTREFDSSLQDPLYALAAELFGIDRFKPLAGNGLALHQVAEQLHRVDLAVTRSFRVLSDLRQVSTKSALQFEPSSLQLWIQFVRFPRHTGESRVEGLKFALGFTVGAGFLHKTSITAVRIDYGTLTEEKLRHHLDVVDGSAPAYFRRLQERIARELLS